MSIPAINEARSLGRKHDLTRCVILFELPDGRIGYTSYGINKLLCEATRRVMDGLFDEIEKRFNDDSERIFWGVSSNKESPTEGPASDGKHDA